MVKGTDQRLILDRYLLGPVIGRGGMGSVVRATDRVLERPVAIKFLKDEYGHDQQTVQRFRHEAQIAAGLMHPGIAQIFDFQEAEGQFFIVMELLEGEDLNTRLRTTGPLSQSEAAQVIAHAADALNYAHTKGAVHRDVKPGNIFLTDAGVVKVTDFGIAIGPSTLPMTVTGKIMGTALYLSPEQIEGRRATSSSDIYSLGCTLYEALTGEPPFNAETQMGIALAHLNRPAPRAGADNEIISKEVDDVITKAMAKNPEERFKSAAEMGSTLLRASGETEEQTAPLDVSSTSLMTVRSPKTDELTSIAGPPKRPRHTFRLVRVLLIIAFTLMLGATLLLTSRRGVETLATLPDFTGKSFESALAEAAALGIDASRIERLSGGVTDKAKGIIVTQEPDSGSEITEATRITVYVSEGIGVRIPNVKGEELDDALEILKTQGFEVKLGTKVPGQDKDIVADQDPAPGTLVGAGSVVTLTVTEEERKGKGKGRGNGD